MEQLKKFYYLAIVLLKEVINSLAFNVCICFTIACCFLVTSVEAR